MNSWWDCLLKIARLSPGGSTEPGPADTEFSRPLAALPSFRRHPSGRFATGSTDAELSSDTLGLVQRMTVEEFHGVFQQNIECRRRIKCGVIV